MRRRTGKKKKKTGKKVFKLKGRRNGIAQSGIGRYAGGWLTCTSSSSFIGENTGRRRKKQEVFGYAEN